jgi:hypothetical protein
MSNTQNAFDAFINLFMTASVNNDKQCNYIKPFNYSEIEKEYNPTTGKVNTLEDIEALKNSIIKINNSANGSLELCCNPALTENSISADLLETYKAIMPFVREIVKNGVLTEIEVSTVAQNPDAGWKPLTPYYLCKLSQTEFIQTSTPNVYKSSSILKDCYSKDCSTDTITLQHLFNSARGNTSYTYYDDAKVAQSIQEGDASGLEKYLRKYNKANVYLTHDDYENTLLHLAARYYKPKILAMLLAVKPNLEARNAEGDKPLHVACRYGNMPVVEQLVKLGAEVNPKNNKGETPIMLAVGYDNPKDREANGIMLRYLYNNGANLFDQDNKGNTILHHIIKHTPDTPEKTKLVRFVVDHGVSAETKNTAGLTALELTADLLSTLHPEPTATGPKMTKQAQPPSVYFAEPKIPYKRNSPFPIQVIEYDSLESGENNNNVSSIGKSNNISSQMTYQYLDKNPATTSSQSTETKNTPEKTRYMPGSNAYSSDMNRLKKWLTNVNPSATVAPLIANPELTKAPYTTKATTQAFKNIEGFQVSKQNFGAMSVKEKELLQIQTLLFNDIIKTNPDKYNKYINVSEVPKGAPVEILDYMCTGGSDEVTGTEDRATCEAMGGEFVKIKNPSTLVKLELLPESERHIAAEDEDELYYPKYPESMPERPLPTLEPIQRQIPATTKAQKKASAAVKPTLTTNEMFTDFSESYVSRDASIMEPINSARLANGMTDNLQIYNQVPEFKNDGNQLAKPNMVPVDLEHPKIPVGQYLVQETVKAGINADIITREANAIMGKPLEKKMSVLMSNVPMLLTAVLLVMILLISMYIWLKK